MRSAFHKPRLFFVLLLCIVGAVPAASQQTPLKLEVPDKFKWDLQTAARLRPQLLSQSPPLPGRHAIGRMVLQKLTNELHLPADAMFSWEIAHGPRWPAKRLFLPEGTIYIESGLAELASESAGLWAAILSHEIAHIVHRDWARRYLYRQSLRNGGGGTTPDDSDLRESTWIDSEKASENLARFCRQQEIEADSDSVMLMARAGYHPDFVPALHHLLRVHTRSAATASIYAMHPGWNSRDHALKRAYVTASIDFDRRWPDWYASPGGNPPVLVFAEEPSVRKSADGEWEIQVPVHCENLVGAVEAVLLAHSKSRCRSIKHFATSSLQTDSSATFRLYLAQSHYHLLLARSPRPMSEPRSDVYVLPMIEGRSLRAPSYRDSVAKQKLAILEGRAIPPQTPAPASTVPLSARRRDAPRQSPPLHTENPRRNLRARTPPSPLASSKSALAVSPGLPTSQLPD